MNSPISSAIRKILIVDDDDDIRELASSTLEKQGCAVIPTSRGADALRILSYLGEENLPTCILLDLVMSEMDGVEVFEKIRHGQFNSKIQSIPIVLATAVEIPPEMIQKSQNVYLLQKPYTAEKLWEMVSSLK